MTKKIKASLALSLVLLCCGAVNAQSFMTFNGNDGNQVAWWHLNEVRTVTFDGGDIVVNATAGESFVPFSDVLSIKFTDNEPVQTSVEKIGVDANQLYIVANGDVLNVHGASQGQVAIWTAAGRQVYSNRDWRGASINIGHLEHGIYLITINNTTFKFKK